MKQLCDLHTHSTFSDGTYTPDQIIETAEKIGLSAVALCDHNTVAGIPSFLEAAKHASVEAVPGSEISVDYHGTELHILALYIPEDKLTLYTEYVDQARKNKEESNRALIASLRDAGYAVEYDAILKKSPSGGFNRLHVAAELMAHGYISSIGEGFDTVLSPEAGYYKPPKRLDAFETIAFIHSTGAVPVLAHPFLNLREDELRAFLPHAVRYGLAGMETLYSKYSTEETELSVAIAREHSLLQSGGSDFHGENKKDLLLGVGYGTLAIPYGFAQELKAIARD